jgi:hypothetical protein
VFFNNPQNITEFGSIMPPNLVIFLICATFQG